MRTVISNGTYRFHLAPLAAEMHKRGQLAALFTGGYPMGIWRDLFRKLPVAGLRRLADRCEQIPDEKIYAFQRTELMFKSAELFGRAGGQAMLEGWQTRGFHLYARMARQALKRIDFDIYHYRNCFGFESAAWARACGKNTICDHSIGHPYAVAWMRTHQSGYLPQRIPPQPLSRLEQNYLNDFEYADHMLVNSNFVKDSFIACGFDPGKISVAWWGVDARFLADADMALQEHTLRKGHTDLLFCGGFGRRKGAHVLLEALDRMSGQTWSLTIAGAVEHDVSEQWEMFRKRYGNRIRMLGFLSRTELASLMSRYRVFVFPSLMEGSARVIFEAMASGCFIITTPHAGSVVEDGLHGLLTVPGDVDALCRSLRSVFDGAHDIDGIGDRNAVLIRDSFRQDQYADRVLRVYETVGNRS